MVRYTHPEMFYLFIPLTLVLIWYAYQGKKLRMGLETLGTSSIKKFLLNRVKYSRIHLRSRLIILGIIFTLFTAATTMNCFSTTNKSFFKILVPGNS